MDRKNLEFTIRELPKFIPELTGFVGYQQLLETLESWREIHSDIIAPLRPLVRSRQGRWIYDQAIGNGPFHTVIEVMPHGGELMLLTAVAEYVMFLGMHPWLLEGRTIHLLLAGPDEAILNLEAWAGKAGAASFFGREQFFYFAFGTHYRNRDPLENDHWSWPIKRDGKWILRPTPGARAGMMLIRQLVKARKLDPRVKLVAWISGHNQLVGYGTHFLVSGPGAAESALIAERFARRFRLKLDPGQADGVGSKRHPGCIASWEYLTGAQFIAVDPTSQVGGCPFDWAPFFFPGMCIQSSEVPMLAPRKRGPSGRLRIQDWEHSMTLGEARQIANRQMRNMRDGLPPLIKLAGLLPANDPLVSATKALANMDAWGKGAPDNRPDSTVLEPAEAFRIICMGPLYRVRDYCPPIWMVWNNLELVRRLHPDPDPVYLAGMHFGNIRQPLDEWRLDLGKQSLRQAAIIQILAAEVAAYGALGIRPRLWHSRKE